MTDTETLIHGLIAQEVKAGNGMLLAIQHLMAGKKVKMGKRFQEKCLLLR